MTMTSDTSVPKEPTYLDFIAQRLSRAIQPHESITDEVERHRLNFIIASFLLFILVFAFVTLTFFLFLPLPALELAAFFVFATHIIAYRLARTPGYRWSIPLSPVSLHVASWLATLATPPEVAIGTVFTTGFVLTTADLWLGTRATLISSVMNIVVILLASVIKNFPIAITVFAFLMIVALTAYLLVQETYRKSLENARRAVLEESLARAEAAQRATQQANEELKRATALAKENARLRSEFMATMSHELRTPLNAIRGFCGIMLGGMGGTIDNDAQHMVERIDDNSKRLLTLINDILDLARIEAGRVEIQAIPFNPHELAYSWREQMSGLAEEKGLAFRLDVSENLPKIMMGDPERITQIAINLLSNAFKFTHQGTVTIRLEVLDHSEQTQWRINVSDTGIGIPAHALNYIFDEFRQLDSSSTRQYGGSGLGLSIVRNLTRMMGGTIQVTSEVDVGSTFSLTLPMHAPVSMRLQSA